jgi:Na+/proline symporter
LLIICQQEWWALLIAIIFLASWGSIAAAINSLASSTMVDFHRRFSKKEVTGEEEYRMSKRYTLLWGIFCVIVAYVFIQPWKQSY